MSAFVFNLLLTSFVFLNFVAAQVGQFGQQYPYHQYYNHGNSITVECGSGNQLCAGKTLTCLHETCKYECFDPSSCAGTKFVTSAITREIDVQCKHNAACAGARVISSAHQTKVQCDDFACISLKLYCRSMFAELCELKCQNHGCVPGLLSNQVSPIPPTNNLFPPPQQRAVPVAMQSQANRLRMYANEVFCKGLIGQCKVVADNEFSFMYGKFTCALTVGTCILECADSFGEVSCQNSRYTCRTNPQNCLCYDQRRAAAFNQFGFVPRGPVSYDCPKILYPKAKAKAKSKGKKKSKAKSKKTKSKTAP